MNNDLPDIYPTPDVPLVPCPLDFTGMSKLERTTAYYKWLTAPKQTPEMEISSGTLLPISTDPPKQPFNYKQYFGERE